MSREAILHLTGFRHRSFYGSDYVVKDRISIRDLAARVMQVVERETGVVRDQLRRNGIDLLCGTAQFLDANTIEVQGATEAHMLHADYVLIEAPICSLKRASDGSSGRRYLTPLAMTTLRARRT